MSKPSDIAGSRPTATGTIRSSAGTAVRILAGGVLAVFLPRALEPEAFSTFAVVTSVVVWVELASSSLFSTAMPRLISDAGDGWRRFAASAAMLSLGLGLLSGFGLFLSAPWIASALGDSSLGPWIRLFALDPPIYVGYLFLNSVLVGRQRFGAWTRAVTTYWVVKVVATIGLVGVGQSVRGAILGSICASMIALLLNFRRAGIGLPRRECSLRPLVALGAPLAAGNLLVSLCRTQDLWLVKALLDDPTAAGAYGVATNVYMTSFMLVVTVSLAALPALRSAIREGRDEAAANLVRGALRFTLIVALGFWALFASSASEIVVLVFSAGYSTAALPATVLLGGMVLFAVGMIVRMVLIAEGHPWREFTRSAAMVLVGLASNLVLIPRFGLVGAASGTSIALAFYGILGLATARRMWGDAFPFRTLLAALIGAGVVLALGSLHAGTGFWLLPRIALLGGFYVASLAVLREVDAGDFRVFVRAFRRYR